MRSPRVNVAVLVALIVSGFFVYVFFRPLISVAPHSGTNTNSIDEAPATNSTVRYGNRKTSNKPTAAQNYSTAELDRALNSPINFWGLVLDQYDKPIPNVRIGIRISSYRKSFLSGWQTQFKTSTVETDTGGRFAVTGEEGTALRVASIFKEGYVESKDNRLGIPTLKASSLHAINYNADNQIANYDQQAVVFDSDGNMTSGPLHDSSISSYQFDSRNRLLGAGGTTYTYDCEGNRLSITDASGTSRLKINPNATLSQVLVSSDNYFSH